MKDRIVMVAGAVLAAGLGGCTTSVVQSVDLSAQTVKVSTASNAPEKDATAVVLAQGSHLYATYPLVKTVFAITVKAAKSGDAAASSSKSASAGDGDASGSTSTSKTTTSSANTVTVNVPLTINNVASKQTASPPDPSAAEKQKQCKAITKAYGALRKQHLANDGKAAALYASIGAILSKQENKITDPDIANAVRDITSYNELVVQSDDQVAKFAEHQLADYAAICATPVSVDVALQYAPDIKHTFALFIADDAFSSDTITYKADANGYMSGLSTTADEKTGSVIAAAANSIITVAGLAGFGGPAPLSSRYLLPIRDQVVQFCPLSGKKLEKIAQLKDCYYGLGPPKPLPDLEEKVPDKPIIEELSNVSSAQGVHVYGQLALVADCDHNTNAPPGNTAPFNGLGIFKDNDSQKDPVYDGVNISLPRTCTVTLVRRGSTDAKVQQADVGVLDSTSWVNLPVLRTSLIARTTNYTFANGRLTEADYVNPSFALAVATLPGTIATQALSSLSTAIQGRTGIATAQNGELAARAAYYNAQTTLISAQAAAQKAAAQQGAASSASP